MGNCCVSCKIIVLPSCVRDAAAQPGKVFKIVKSDGKILEFTSPTLVKDILVDFSGFVIGLSQDSSHNEHLPPNYELKMGEVYYMLPSLGSGDSPAPDSFMEDSEKTSSSTRRIRIVITKKQLQQLLAKQAPMEELIMQLEKTSCTPLDSSTTWKPTLEAIPEGIE